MGTVGRVRDVSNARDHALEALLRMEREGERARSAVEALRGELADPRDRALLTEIVYGVVRRRPTLDAVLATFSKTPLPRLDPVVLASLRAALFQLLFLDRVPPFAAVDAAVGAVKRRLHPRLAGFVNGVLRTVVRSIEGPATGPERPRCDVPRPGSPALRLSRPVFPDPAHDPDGSLGARYAHPAWLVRRVRARYDEATTRRLLELGCSQPPLSLRALPGRRTEVLASLHAAGVAARLGAQPDEVVVPDGDPSALDAVRSGAAYVQDGTAQRVAPLVLPRPAPPRPLRILDLCAAPGGKTAHLLDLSGPDGPCAAHGPEVVAADVDPSRIAVLRQAVGDRATVVQIPSEGPLPFPPRSFDAVLVDAPCSNTGVLRRRPEVRLRLRPDDLTSLVALQGRLLSAAAGLVIPGGRLVYATCSIEPEENEGVVDAFLRATPGASRTDGFFVLPTPDADGGFAAVLTLPS